MRRLALVTALVALSGCSFAQEDAPPSRGGDFGVMGLVAERRDPISNGRCGVEKPIVVRQVAGVTLSPPAIMNVRTAHALSAWMRKVAIPAVGDRGDGLAEIRVAAHYACRTRNSRRGARLSEHAKGNAIDIAALRMRDGSEVTVLQGWRRKGDSALLKKLHRGACGPFGTVLGPNADRHHQDHFHFDTAAYRSGTYCR